MKILRVKNWEKHQHYKNRTPPWIKLQRDLLRDYKFMRLQDASKLHLMLIWLLASQMDNEIPYDEEFIKMQIGVKDKVNLKPLLDMGYLYVDSGMLADCKQSAMPEEEAEEEKREKIEEEFSKFWEAYPKKRNNPKKPARDKFISKRKAGNSLDEILEGAKNYSYYCKQEKTEEKFIAQTVTWLNQERWNDDLQTKGQSKWKTL